MAPDAQSIVGDLMHRWPATGGRVPVLRDAVRRLSHPRFHSVGEACAGHRVEREPFLGELRAVAAVFAAVIVVAGSAGVTDLTLSSAG